MTLPSEKPWKAVRRDSSPSPLILRRFAAKSTAGSRGPRNSIIGPMRAQCPGWGAGRFCDVGCESALPRILLQKSKVASVRIFGEPLKREAIDDSYNLSRVTEVAYEFNVRR